MGENSASEYGTDDQTLKGFEMNSNWLKNMELCMVLKPKIGLIEI